MQLMKSLSLLFHVDIIIKIEQGNKDGPHIAADGFKFCEHGLYVFTSKLSAADAYRWR